MTLYASAKRLGERYLSPDTREQLRRRYRAIRASLYSDDLRVLATIYGSDKWNTHWYAQHYEHHFRPLRHRPVNLLEIGVGGYDNPTAGGASLRMWKRFFPRGHIYGVDVYDKSALQESRITIFRGSQRDPAFLRATAATIGRLDIVVDDGSHRSEDVITAFETLFPLLADGGIYAIEDTQTSYWPEYGGQIDPRAEGTTMSRLKLLVDGLNYVEFLDPSYAATEFDRRVTSVHFYHNLAIIYKGANAEESYRP